MTTNGTDPQQIAGYTVQGHAPNPYSQGGVTASTSALTTAGNGSPGAPGPIAGDVENILANSVYGDVPPSLITRGTALPASLVPVPASGTAVPNPAGLSCTVVITGGTVTAVTVTPYGGTPAGVGTGDGTYTVPAGATVTLTYSAAPSWAWTTV